MDSLNIASINHNNNMPEHLRTSGSIRFQSDKRNLNIHPTATMTQAIFRKPSTSVPVPLADNVLKRAAAEEPSQVFGHYGEVPVGD